MTNANSKLIGQAISGTAVLALLATPVSATADRGRSDSIIHAIMKLQPRFTKARAARLAKDFEAASRSSGCHIPLQFLMAVAFHESSMGVNLVNSKTKDYGIMQINQKTAHRMGFSTFKLISDDKNSIVAACKILEGNKKAYGNRPYWIGVYRSGTAFYNPKIVNNAKRYHKMITSTASFISNGR